MTPEQQEVEYHRTLLSCFAEEVRMLFARKKHGEPLYVLSLLPSAWHHWRWLRSRRLALGKDQAQ